MQIPFFFDYACPWAYLGSCRVEAHFQDLGVEIDFRPVSLKVLYEPPPGGAGRPKLGARKQANYANDLRHWADFVGAEFAAEQPERRPDSGLLLRAALVAQDAGRFREFHYPAYRARWAEARDVSQPSVVRALLEGAGLEGDAALAQAESAELADRLERESRAAVARGVFGVPTLFVGDEMFWGNDRYELVRHYVAKTAG
ncbi:MAG: DsbA family protein [Myxococcota bacterium]|nr:DsbA family protein [Myxococcota bacterium]